jgi:hypothetical protein
LPQGSRKRYQGFNISDVVILFNIFLRQLDDRTFNSWLCQVGQPLPSPDFVIVVSEGQRNQAKIMFLILRPQIYRPAR